MHTPTPFGYRIVGCVQGKRRLVNASAAFLGYAGCDAKAEIRRGATFPPISSAAISAKGTTAGG